MAIGRISGPLLKENLTRDGVNLRFETDLLYLKVTDPNSANHRIGIKNSNPAYTLDVTGTARATTFLAGELDVDDVYINNNSISSQLGDLVLSAATSFDKVTINSNVLVNGNLHATGSITADGSLTFGDNNTDNVVFAADINSDFLPNVTDTFKLGTPSKRWDQLNVHNANIGDLQIQDNIIEPINTNGDLVLRANGTGQIVISGSIGLTGNITLSGDLAVNGGDLTSTNPSFNLLNQPTTINFGTSATAIEIGSSTGQTSINHAVTVDGSTTLLGLLTVSNNVSVIGNTTQTGNISLTGNLIVTGDIIGGPLITDDIRVDGNLIRTTASNSSLDLRSNGTGTILVNGKDLLNYDATTWYVSEDSGSDSNDGRRPYTAFATLKYALTQVSSGDTVLLSPGTYTEVFPITVPQGVTVKGAGLRATKIKPTVGTNNKDCFLLNGETTVEDMTIADMFYDSVNNTGYAFRFAPTTTVSTRSPYVQRVTVFNKGSGAGSGDPYGFTSADAGRGAYLDGSQVTRASLEAAILFNECTFIVPNSRALIMTNGARTEWLNCFTYFADLAIEGVVGATGRGGDGKTYVTFGGVSGSGFQVGETVRLTSTDSSTVINLVVDSVAGSKITVDGSVGTLEGEDFTPASIVGLTSGTTATSVTRYDRSEFAAELRAISGANVYGNQGVKADGDDVVIQLMAWNFAYIGTGADLTNDKSAVIQANEVIEVNNGRVYYNSVDQVGNFRIGDLFSVNFETGAVSFSAPTFDVSSLTGITFTDGTNVTIINPTTVQTGNLVLAGNTLSSTTGGITIDPSGNETLNLNANTTVSGNLDVGGNVTIGGTITVGNADTDSITVVADFTSNLLPNESNTYDLGSPSKEWRTLYAGQITNGNIVIDDNYIRTTVSNSNLELNSNGTGTIELQDNTNVTGNLGVTGTVTATNMSSTGQVTFATGTSGSVASFGTTGDRVWINGGSANNTIYSENNQLQIAPGGLNWSTQGALFTSTNVAVKYTTTSTSSTTGALTVAGGVGIAENLNVGGTLNVNGLSTLDNLQINGTTILTGPITANNNVNIAGTLTVTGDIVGGPLRTDDIQIVGNRIETTASNSNFEINTVGTGSIELLANSNITGTLDVSGQTTLASANIEDLTSGRVVLAGASGELEDSANLTFNGSLLTVTGNQKITGNLDVDGDITLGGNIRIGDQELDTVTVQADFTSDLIPNASNLYDLGTAAKQWRVVNAAEFDNGTININDNVIRTTVSNSNLELRASGTGIIVVPQNNVSFSQTLTVDGLTTLDQTVVNDILTVNANSTFNGDVTVTGNLTVTGNTAQTGNYTVVGNLEVTKDISTSTVQTDDIRIEGNVITTTLSNSDLELRANGTGTIELQENTNVTGTLDVNTSITTPVGNITVLNAGEANIDGIRIDTNVISTVNSNANIELKPSGSGIVYIQGTGAVRIPAGNTAERPSTGEVGFIRYNSQTNNIEAWNGVVFAGISGGGSSSDANGDTRITFETSGNNEDIIRFFAGLAGPTPGSTIGANEIMQVSNNGVIINGTIKIQNNVIENINSNDDLILRASGTGRVILDGSGEPGSSGNVYATDPLLTLNSSQTSANGYDSGLIIERGSDINTAIIWDESADEFAFISTIEQGTVKGNVSITGYQNLSSASIKINSESINKVTFTDASKIVRSLDTGRTAYVDGVMKFNTGAQVAIPTGTTVQRPVSAQEGSIRYNTTDQVFEGFADGGWQGLGIGYGSAPNYQGFVGNGSQYEFTLSETPLSSAGVIVTLNGVVQEPEYSYRVEDNILMFIDESSTVVAPDLGDRIDVRFISKPAISTVRERSFVGDGSTRSFAMTLPIRSQAEVLVFVNNIYQDVAVYSISGKNVIFDQAPQGDDRINIVHIAGIVAPNVATIQEADDSAIAFSIALG